MNKHLDRKPARLGRFMLWLKSTDPRTRPSRAARKFTHHQERRAAMREIREEVCQ